MVQRGYASFQRSKGISSSELQITAHGNESFFPLLHIAPPLVCKGHVMCTLVKPPEAAENTGIPQLHTHLRRACFKAVADHYPWDFRTS